MTPKIPKDLTAAYNERLAAYATHREPMDPTEASVAIGFLLGGDMPSCAAMVTLLAHDWFQGKDREWLAAQIDAAIKAQGARPLGSWRKGLAKP